MTRKAVKAAAGKAVKPPAKIRPAVKKAPASGKARKEDDVDGFFATFEHPLRKEYADVRKIVIGADKTISEGVKWNSVSFRTSDYFATVNLRSRDAVQLVLHRGATSKSGSKTMEISDPRGLLKWLSSDRALLTLGVGATFRGNLPALEKIVAAWVAQL